ncbi:hypothetical protein KEM52_004597 [Ascosphaera acerosa]|nr:hypothetical protein KEM52_004597 [Ascosphaera acerosa]
MRRTRGQASRRRASARTESRLHRSSRAGYSVTRVLAKPSRTAAEAMCRSSRRWVSWLFFADRVVKISVSRVSKRPAAVSSLKNSSTVRQQMA